MSKGLGGWLGGWVGGGQPFPDPIPSSQSQRELYIMNHSELKAELATNVVWEKLQKPLWSSPDITDYHSNSIICLKTPFILAQSINYSRTSSVSSIFFYYRVVRAGYMLDTVLICSKLKKTIPLRGFIAPLNFHKFTAVLKLHT